MNDQTPLLGPPWNTVNLPPIKDQTLQDLAANANIDQVHFFIHEAIEQNAIPLSGTSDGGTFSLVPYSDASGSLNDESFRVLHESGLIPATLSDLLNFAGLYPELQREFDIIALGTLRTRQVFKDRPGKTLWDQTERDRTICQWATGLSTTQSQRTLIPIQLYLDQLLDRPTLLLVRPDQA